MQTPAFTHEPAQPSKCNPVERKEQPTCQLSIPPPLAPNANDLSFSSTDTKDRRDQSEKPTWPSIKFKMAEITLNLLPGGKDVEKNNYHTLDAYPGQVERADVYDYGSKLNMQMNLVEIVHGTMDSKPNSSPATLIIADFQFISHDPSRRF